MLALLRRTSFLDHLLWSIFQSSLHSYYKLQSFSHLFSIIHRIIIIYTYIQITVPKIDQVKELRKHKLLLNLNFWFSYVKYDSPTKLDKISALPRPYIFLPTRIWAMDLQLPKPMLYLLSYLDLDNFNFLLGGRFWFSI